VKQIVNQEQDMKDQQADAAEMKALQAQILSCYQQDRQELKEFKGAVDKQELIIARQLKSVQWQLQRMQRAATESKSLIPPDYEIPFFELTLREIIGQGGIATVYAGLWGSQPVAIKLLSASLSGKEGREFTREAQILSRLRNPFIVPFYGACLEEGHACLVMEYLPLGSLHDYLPKNLLTLVQKKQIAEDISKGLQYLHKKGLIHGDLRSANILLTGERRAKIADFGLTQTRAYSVQSLGKISPAVAWCAPELFREEKLSEKSDIFSLGMLLWELFMGKQPFAGLTTEAQLQKILAGERETFSDSVPKEWKKIITVCWSPNPDDRPELTDIITQIAAFDPAAYYYRQGKTAEKTHDYKFAADCYQQAKELKLTQAHTSIAMLLLVGKGMAQNKVQAYQLLLIAATAGHQRAMKNLAIMLDKGDGVKQDLRQALFWYQRAGDPSALQRAKRLTEKLSLSLSQ
jgi:serine/threonine protein kinase